MLRAIAGAQSQEPRAGRLQLRARSRRLDAAGVERARVEERSIVRGWLMRGTVHLVAAGDYGWMLPLFAPRIIAQSRRRLEQLGLTAIERDRSLRAARDALESSGPLPRSAVVEVARRAGVEIGEQRRVHLFTLLCAEGSACVGPDRGRETTVVARRDWIGETRPRDRDAALAELARRYYGAFAPATVRDFAAWSGLSLRDCRKGTSAIAAELDELPAGGDPLMAPRGFRARAPRSPLVRLLPAFDTYLMGYANRAHAVDGDGHRRILPGGGVLRPTICVDGRFVGLWSNRRSGTRLRIELDPFEGLSDEVIAALAAEARDIGRFEGVEAALA